jgi:hypothetical protein
MRRRCRGRLSGGGSGVGVGGVGGGGPEEEARFGFGGGGRFRGRHHVFAAPPPAAPLLRAPDDDALYETADAERLRDAPDSER